MTHHNTILAQLLKLVPRHEFEALARRFHKGRTPVRGSEALTAINHRIMVRP